MGGIKALRLSSSPNGMFLGSGRKPVTARAWQKAQAEPTTFYKCAHHHTAAVHPFHECRQRMIISSIRTCFLPSSKDLIYSVVEAILATLMS